MKAHDLQMAFRRSGFVKHFFYYPSIDSTNAKARELALRGAEEGTLVIADAQTAGRGRNERTWYSPPGLGLYVSFILRPGTPAEAAFGILMAVALGAAGAVTKLRPTGSVGIKWPNDLMLEGRKLGGLLSEVGMSHGAVDWAVVGVGLNVNHQASDFPAEIRDRATSLRISAHREIDRVALLQDLVERAGTWYGEYLERGMVPLLPEWRRRSVILGRMVRVETAGETYVGIADGIQDDGALRVRLESGTIETLHAGDVQLVQMR